MADGTEKVKGLAAYCKERIGRFDTWKNEIIFSGLSNELKTELISLLCERLQEWEKLQKTALLLLE
jgi:hypothetical protein